MAELTPITVLIVDDDALVRSALTLMLGGQPDIEVIGEAEDGAQGVAAARALSPDVVLLDVRMPVMSGLAATRLLHEQDDPPAVLVLTTFDADEYVVEAVAAGANGFLLKNTPPAEIVAAVRQVAAGDAVVSPAATRSLLDQIRSGGSSPHPRTLAAVDRLAALTAREQEVAICVGRGLSNAEIATELHLSIPTVKAHVSKLLEKLGVANRVQIAMVVHDAGLA
ncbi:MAG: response regulator [Nocardioides sp.]|uniref:response regulator n=1 Tax=Nocardioides sp. TaxID=35761 RepID=UPI003F0869B6